MSRESRTSEAKGSSSTDQPDSGQLAQPAADQSYLANVAQHVLFSMNEQEDLPSNADGSLPSIHEISLPRPNIYQPSSDQYDNTAPADGARRRFVPIAPKLTPQNLPSQSMEVVFGTNMGGSADLNNTFRCGCGFRLQHKNDHRKHVERCNIKPHKSFRCRCKNECQTSPEHLQHLNNCQLQQQSRHEAFQCRCGKDMKNKTDHRTHVRTCTKPAQTSYRCRCGYMGEREGYLTHIDACKAYIMHG